MPGRGKIAIRHGFALPNCQSRNHHRCHRVGSPDDAQGRVARPCIAVAALNPHAGEGGLFGYDEIEMITEQQFETKFSDLAESILPAPMIRRVMDACWTIEGLPGAAEIAKMSV